MEVLHPVRIRGRGLGCIGFVGCYGVPIVFKNPVDRRRMSEDDDVGQSAS